MDQFAAQRAVNAKEYLVTEQGIDASRISVATGTTDGQTVENYLVPAGASFTTDVTGTTPVDETAVKPQVRKPLPERHPTKKAAAQQAACPRSTRKILRTLARLGSVRGTLTCIPQRGESP